MNTGVKRHNAVSNLSSNFLELSSDLSSIFTNVCSTVASLLSTFVRRSACSVSGLTAGKLTAAARSPTCEERPPILRSIDAVKSRAIFLMVSNLGSIFSLFSSPAGVVPRRGRFDDDDTLGAADGRGRIGIRGCSVGCWLRTSPSSDSDQSSYTVSSSGMAFSTAPPSSSCSARRILSLILVAISACNAWGFCFVCLPKSFGFVFITGLQSFTII